MPINTLASFQKSRLSKAITLACIALVATPITVQAATSCGTAGTTTITAAETDQCSLVAGESLVVSETWSITTPIISPFNHAVSINSLTVGSITNNGSLIVGGDKTGIRIENNSTTGSIINNGVITADDGIDISGVSTVLGDISNTGTITSTYGIDINDDTRITGGISNAGTITSDSSAIRIGDNVTIGGSVSNSGTITVGFDKGIEISGASTTISGGITNSGTITADDAGIYVDNSTVSGGITNSGTITGSTGIYITNVSTIGGGISNTGTITANQGIYINGNPPNNSSVSGGITNAGTIISVSTGIALLDVSVVGSVTNSGTIIGYNGIDIFRDTTTISGGLINSGAIISSNNAISFTIDNAVIGFPSKPGHPAISRGQE
ncbi:MAG: hypothetical protein A6F70_09230 [Cycloclasticus sp. symbiont of Bathymodiolus heckerae]|nr:MAG: hypothetical protein A6F70_09230 [Cycloclasticus sp. symbiont of Bathymodiolus heckerae]